MRGRAYRRDKMARLKAFWRKVYVQRFGWYEQQRPEPDERWVARQSETHGAPCGCRLCKYPKGWATARQAGDLLTYHEQLAEAGCDRSSYRWEQRRQYR